MNVLKGFVVVFEYLNAVSLPVLGAVLLLSMILVAELGMLAGRSAVRRVTDKDAGHLATAALGLLALLIAFTYSMALTRYDLRRTLVLQEANAIGTAAHYARALPQAERAPTFDLLRRYALVRLNLGVPYDEAKLVRDVATSNTLLEQLWTRATAATDLAPQSLPQHRYIAALNDATTIAEARLTALRNHVPVTILAMLVGTALVAMGFSGYSAGVGGVNRQVSLGIMSMLLTCLILVTQDLGRPDRGTIEVSTQALQDTVDAIPPAPPP